MDLKPYYEMVESCITDLGIDASKCRGEQPGQWDLYKGSARVMIDVFTQESGWSYFQCIAPIVAVPADKKIEFYEEILEKNHQLYGVAMTKFKEWIYIKVIREIAGIDKDEMMAMINRIGVYADELDDLYKTKYHGGNA